MMAEQGVNISAFGEILEAAISNYTGSMEKAQYVLKEEIRTALRNFLGRDLADDVMPAKRDPYDG